MKLKLIQFQQMNQANVALLVAALRSDKYTQCAYYLRDENGCNCVMGVAIEVFMEHNLGIITRGNLSYCRGESIYTNYMPTEVYEWYGFPSEDGLIGTWNGKKFYGLDDLNDRLRLTFSEIADVIERTAALELAPL